MLVVTRGSRYEDVDSIFISVMYKSLDSTIISLSMSFIAKKSFSAAMAHTDVSLKSIKKHLRQRHAMKADNRIKPIQTPASLG